MFGTDVADRTPMSHAAAQTILSIQDLVVDFDSGKPTVHRALDSVMVGMGLDVGQKNDFDRFVK